ncbi:MAG: ATP-dependent helicase [Sphingobacteriales bacterium]|nr:MAG: ATP-dependent helicase [Sphingobacteriales bacterium]
MAITENSILREQFDKVYGQLNQQQQMAVNRIEGPVMVIAGPGTGKTQILSARIAKILMETDAQPENILCLTYTEAGVVAMRKRLLSFIGPDAYKVGIYTFHAFCNEVIQDNLGLFEKNILDPLSELEKTALYKELIDAFPKNHALKRYRGDVYFEINNLQQLFSTIKREGWTPAFISERIDVYLADLPTRDEFVYKKKYKNFVAGDVKQHKIDEEKEKMEKLRAAVNEFPAFQQLMRQRNRYDFDDMITWVITAFANNKTLLANYQEKFQYILVDEFQDTSGTQNSIIKLLIEYWESPNIFVVGDDDQSIYRFQGANIENMQVFAENYQRDLFTVILTNNYRSTQPILDASKVLIAQNTERLVNKMNGLSKELRASNTTINQLQHLPLVYEYELPRHEMIFITEQITALLANGVAPGKIAVIYKEHRYGEELAAFFRFKQLPYYSKRELNILELPLAQKLLLILKYVAAELDMPTGGDEMLFEILHFDWFGIPPLLVAQLSMEVAAKQFSADKTSIRALLQQKIAAPPKDLFAPPLNSGLQKAGTVLESLMTDAVNVTLQQLFENIIQKAGVLSAIMQLPDKIEQLRILTGLFDFIKDETKRNPFLTLQQLVNYIQLMEKEKVKLPLIQVNGTDKGVNLLTAHGSKGLEFEYVFIAGSNAHNWEKKRKPSGGYKLPDTIFESVPAHTEEEELRRVFYVAVTRAEQHLYISYSRFNANGKEAEASKFVEEIKAGTAITTERKMLLPDTEALYIALQFTNTFAPEIAQLEKDFANRLLEKFVMNVTALNNYLKCPLEFYFKNLVRIPSPKNENTEFGSAVHYALEQLFKKMQEGKVETFPPKHVFIEDFEWYMHRHRESFTQEQFDRRIEYGHIVLNDYYDSRVAGFNKIVAIERSIRNVQVSGVPVKGKLDKLEFDGKQVTVIDYKTGNPVNAKDKLKPPSAKDPNGGDYWRQAVFYKLLVDNHEQRGWKVVATVFDFVEPDAKKEYQQKKLVITPEDEITVRQQIIDTWQKIQAHQFYTGCGKEDCHWCNFVKTNNLAIALHETVTADEETAEEL